MTRCDDQQDCCLSSGSGGEAAVGGASWRALSPDFVLPRLFDSLGLFGNLKLFGEAQAIALLRVGAGQGEKGDQPPQLCSKE